MYIIYIIYYIIIYDMVFVFPRWVGYTTPTAPTAQASLESAHLGSLELLFLPPLTLPCLQEKIKYKDHRSRRLSQLLPNKIGFYF